MKPFHATDFMSCPMKTSVNQRFSDFGGGVGGGGGGGGAIERASGMKWVKETYQH